MKNCLAMVSPEVHSTQVVWIELTEFSIRHKRHKPWRVYDREFRFVSWKAEERSKQNFSSNYNGIQKFWKRTPDMLLTDVVQPLHLQWNLPPLHNMVEGTIPYPIMQRVEINSRLTPLVSGARKVLHMGCISKPLKTLGSESPIALAIFGMV